jgi:DNA-binding SARP family transcriptional activator
MTQPSDAVLTLSLLGNTLLQAQTDGKEPVAIFSSGKPLALIAYLHCAPAQSASREQLLELLWSDAEPESARHTLRQTLWYIRRKLGLDPFVTTGDGLRLAVPVTSDRAAFLHALEVDNPDLAMHSYTGDFFPEFAAPGGASFEHWADLERARLRSLFVGAATRAVHDRLGKGKARDAVAIARRAHELAPRHQSAWRLLLESCLAADDTIGATVELERLERWLSDEELEPDPATAAIIKTARNGKSATAAPTNTTPTTESGRLQAELVGRESEFAELLSAFDVAKRGHARHVHVVGTAGVGKSRLLDGFAARLRTSRVRVVAVRGTPGERALPYAFAAHLVGALVSMRGAAAVSPDAAGTLVALAPAASTYLKADADRTSGDEALRRRSLAVVELVSALAHDAPLVLLIDDVHWIDTASKAVLASLATRAEQAELLLVTAARPSDRFVDDTPAASSLELAPLTADEVGALVMSIGQLPTEPWTDVFVSSLHHATDGSPLLVLETLQLVMERDLLELRDRAWSTTNASALLDTLNGGRAMQQRLSALAPAARDALLRLAIAGTAVDDASLPMLLAEDGREALATMETRGLISRVQGAWRVAHDEIASLAIEMAGHADRLRAHTAMAEYLERTANDDVARLLRAAQHRVRAEDTAALDRTFFRAVRLAHASGELATIRNLGREVLGQSASSADVEQLVTRLPWRVRHRPQRWLSGLAFTASVGVLALTLVVRNSASAPASAADTQITLVANDGAARVVGGLSLSLTDLTHDGPLELLDIDPPFAMSVLDSVGVADRLHDGDFVGSTIAGTETEEMNVVRVSRSGRVSTLAGGPRDQASPVASPDGRFVAFTTGAWHPDQRADIGIVDVQTGALRRITDTDEREISLNWSRDGSRIAFVRSSPTDSIARICWTTVDTTRSACTQADRGLIPLTVLGWSSDHSVLVTSLRKPDQQLILLEVDFASPRRVRLDSSGSSYSSDPSGRIVFCTCYVVGYPDERLAVFATASPGRKRVLQRAGRDLRAQSPQFVFFKATNRFLERVQLRGAANVSVGQRIRYTVSGYGADGAERSVPLRSFRSLDTTIAEIDSAGVAEMKSAGRVRFVVSAGGWRVDTLSVLVGAGADRVVFREDWDKPLDTRWIAFGTPEPSIEQSSGRASLRVNGDGMLSSGVVSRMQIDPRAGLGFRASVRIPITIAQWQHLAVGFDYETDSITLAHWNEHERTRGLEPPAWIAERGPRLCVANLPAREGGEFVDLISFVAAQAEVRLQRVPPRFADANWHNVTLQIFPDGRCGIAIDDLALALSQTALAIDRPLRVRLDGQSVKTTIEVGEVEVWTGVRPGIDWQNISNGSHARAPRL